MAEYIQTKEPCKSCVHKKACETWMRYLKTIHNDDDYSTYNCPDYLSTADVEPVRHGKWNDWEVFWKECSCCQYRTQRINIREYFFCPKCGEKMNDEVDT